MPDINAMWQWAVDTCNAPNVGYSRGPAYNEPANRNAGVANGITYYDCSSFVNFALNAGGFETPNFAPNHEATTTWDLGGEFTRLGWHQIGNSAEILAGDVGLNPDSHTEICYQGGIPGTAIFMGAHTHNAPLAYQVSIGNSYGDETAVSSASRWQQIWRYQDGGASGVPVAKFSFYVCAAICGNWFVESNCNPGVWESLIPTSWDHQYQYDGIGGYGLGQWTNVGSSHGRCYNLSQFLAANDYNADSGDGECDFTVQEAYWKGATGGTGLNDFLNSTSTDIDSLTSDFMSSWEGISNGTLSTRQEKAHEAYNYITEHWTDDIKWIIGNRYLSNSEWLNNCCCIYQWFNLNFAQGVNSGNGGGSTSSGNSGIGNANTNNEANTDWYSLFLSMLAMCGNKETAQEALRILMQRKK